MTDQLTIFDMMDEGDREVFAPKKSTDVEWKTIRNSQTFPRDYDFGGDKVSNVRYICGMSVPPVMMKRIVMRLIEQGVFNYKGAVR